MRHYSPRVPIARLSTGPNLSWKWRIANTTIVIFCGLVCGCVGTSWVNEINPSLEAGPTTEMDKDGRDGVVTGSETDPWKNLLPDVAHQADQVQVVAKSDNDSVDSTDLLNRSGRTPLRSDATDTARNERELVRKIDSVTMAELNEELEAVRAIDAELYAQLRDDLKQTDPTIWPMMVKNIRAALAYREGQDASQKKQENVQTGGDDPPDDVQQALHEEELLPTRQRSSVKRTNLLRNKGLALRSGRHSLGKRRDLGAERKIKDNDAVQESPLDPFATDEEWESGSTVSDKEEQAQLDSDAKDNLEDSLPEERLPLQSSQDEKKSSQDEKVSLVTSSLDETEELTDEARTVASGQVSGSLHEWDEQLMLAIATLETKLDQQKESASDDPSYESDQALLHMLYLAAGKPRKASDDIPGLDEDRQLFWSNLLRALRDYLDVDSVPVADRRAAKALRDLRDAADNLANLSQLEIGELAFCSRVESYGRYTEISSYEFEPDQEVLLYVEIDHFTAKRGESGDYKTEFEAMYQLIDSSGQRVADHTFPKEHEVCRNRRRDYFIPFRMWFPKKIYPGEYTLQLTVEDKIGNKFGQASVDFSIQR